MESVHDSLVILVVMVTIISLWLRRKRIYSPKQTPARNELTSSSRQKRKVQLHHVNPPGSRKKEIEADIDIIAIHGLDANSPDTWIWKKNPKDPEELGVNWLADEHMLPSVIGRARIFTCDWPATLLETPELVQNTFDELARLLLDSIKNRPLANDQKRKDQPILFIASCIGGIILLKALVIANDEYLPIQTATRGIIFLATPFRGTAFQDVANWAEPGLKTWASIQGYRLTNLLDLVKDSTHELNELVRSFTRLHKTQDYEVFTFYEKGYTNLYRKIPYSSIFSRSKKQLVDETSATLDCVPNPLSLNRGHAQMNKFGRPEDPDYQSVSNKIQEFLENILRETPLQIADAYIRNKYYTTEKLNIQRLFNKPLSMEQCYINLAIVEKFGEHTHLSGTRSMDVLKSELYPGFGDTEELHPGYGVAKETRSGRGVTRWDGFLSEYRNEEYFPSSQLIRVKNYSSGSRSRNRAPEPPPFPLSSGLKVETSDEKLQVELSTLFDPRGMSDGQTKIPRRILIRGRAGIGKTTLCKKIVYDFIHNNMWQDLFARVLWVPLRELKKEGYRKYNLEEIFSLVYFKDQLHGDSLSKGLWNAIEAINFRDSLFILDGLDEVSELLDRSHAAATSLMELLNQPNVIITTRPHTIPPFEFKRADLELESIGFYPNQVQDYLEKVVRDARKVEEIRSSLRKHWLLQTFVRIPIQLDALCLIWDEDFKNIPETMTAIYKTIVHRLWKKDIVHLGKRPEIFVKFAGHSEIEDDIELENELLQCLAFSGMCNDVVEFQPEHRDAIRKLVKVQKGGPTLDELLGQLSFLRTSDPSAENSNRSYHFLHLTFQEFFAAQYFTRQWKDQKELKYVDFGSREFKTSSIHPIDFLQQHKYHARYNIVWRFAAGLFGPEEVPLFFDGIEKEPLDLLGPAHQRLVMHCLNEVDSSNKLLIEPSLVEKLSQWLLFQCDLRASSALSKESEFPDQAILTAFSAGSSDQRKLISFSLENSKRRLSETVIAALIALLKTPDKSVQHSAARALRSQLQLSDGEISALIRQLKPPNKSVQYSAVEAFKCQSSVLKTAITDFATLSKIGIHMNCKCRIVQVSNHGSVDPIRLLKEPRVFFDKPRSTSLDPQTLESQYKRLLYCGFSKSAYLYIKDTPKTCIIYYSNGRKEISLEHSGSADQFLAAVKRARQRLNTSNYNLWG
ncbi:nacht nucleoside triphosphatase [Camillea tinctor]|nr:nacht nucleoside triphosphatase [Camillea tinctor]